MSTKFFATLAREPAARAYLGGCLVDDLGIAVSLWATQLLQTDLMTDQHARAALALPTLVAMLLGTLAAGWLADGRGKAVRASAELVRRRFRVLALGRVIETVVLASLVVLIATGPVTIARILPFTIVAGFMKTALRPARLAFAADVLEDEAHFPSLSTWIAQARTVSVVAGLLVGGVLMRAVAGRAWILFAFDVLTNLAFLIGLGLAARRRALTLGPSAATSVAAHVPVSGVGPFRFLLRAPVLVAVIAGSWLLEMVAELYDGRMIVRHVLDGSADAVRWMELATNLTSLVLVALVPFFLRRVRAERFFAAAMLIDGVVMFVGGRLAGTHLLVPFVAVLAVDSGLTSVASVAGDVVTVRDTPAHLRGRVQGIYQLVVLVSAMVAEGVATVAADAHGIPWLVSAAGIVQVGVALGLGAFFLLRRRPEAGKALPTSANVASNGTVAGG
jgi:ENTS family enterobactin (siderophore) exporter